MISPGSPIVASDFDGIKQFKGYGADAGSNDTYVITISPTPASYVTGDTYVFKANTANTGPATLNVNSLGAKTIVKSYNVALADGDIKAGQFIVVTYDGTNFQLQSPVTSQFLCKTGSTTWNSATSGDQTIAHGLGVKPKFIRITCYGGIGGGGPRNTFNVGAYDGTNQWSLITYEDNASTTNAVSQDTSKIIVMPGTTGGVARALASFDATNITLTWAQDNGTTTTGTVFISWEAYA